MTAPNLTPFAWMECLNRAGPEKRYDSGIRLAKAMGRKKFISFYNDCVEYKVKFPKAFQSMEKAFDEITKEEEIQYE